MDDAAGFRHDKLPPHPEPATGLADGAAGLTVSRRRLLRAGAVTAPLILTLHARPALAETPVGYTYVYGDYSDWTFLGPFSVHRHVETDTWYVVGTGPAESEENEYDSLQTAHVYSDPGGACVWTEPNAGLTGQLRPLAACPVSPVS